MLDLSKIEAGQLQLENGHFHLSAILDNVHSIVAESARAKNLLVEIDRDHVPVWLSGDATRLRQALLNYAANAVKFTEAGRVTLRAELLEDTGDTLWLRFSVQDTGIGLTPEQQARIFQPFEQADATTARRYGGSGLGLVITRRLAQLMGGEAGVESRPGVGSTFWFTARLRHGLAEAAGSAANTAPGDHGAALRQRHPGARVLLAEDNEVNREVALALLQAVGLEVDCAADGSEAVARARAGHYDLVLMDMQMPGVDGLAATRTIRTLPGWQDTPILALTANAFEEDRRACEQAGMNDFISKPMDVDRLYATLLRWLSGRPAPAADQSASR